MQANVSFSNIKTSTEARNCELTRIPSTESNEYLPMTAASTESLTKASTSFYDQADTTSPSIEISLTPKKFDPVQGMEGLYETLHNKKEIPPQLPERQKANTCSINEKRSIGLELKWKPYFCCLLLIAIVAFVAAILALVLITVQFGISQNSAARIMNTSMNEQSALPNFQDIAIWVQALQLRLDNSSSQYQDLQIVQESQLSMIQSVLSNNQDIINKQLKELQLQLNDSNQVVRDLHFQLSDRNKTLQSLNTKIQDLQIQRNISKTDFLQLLSNVNESLHNSQSLLENQLTSQTEKLAMQEDQLNTILTLPKGSVVNPARSCSEIPLNSPSAYYWVQASNTNNTPVQVYCDMNRMSCSCSSTTGGWMKVANLDMTDPTQSCPAGFRQLSNPRRCARPLPGVGCISTVFPTYGVQYSRVCGRITAYQDQNPDGLFNTYTDIDQPYVDGVSLTHGQSPRQHIWTFAAAPFVSSTYCPCFTSSQNTPRSSFVGLDYFCDTATATMAFSFFPNNPLWDGQGCDDTGSCCGFNSPPWFCKQLPQPTTNNIEFRLCSDMVIGYEGTHIELVEIFVK